MELSKAGDTRSRPIALIIGTGVGAALVSKYCFSMIVMIQYLKFKTSIYFA